MTIQHALEVARECELDAKNGVKIDATSEAMVVLAGKICKVKKILIDIKSEFYLSSDSNILRIMDMLGNVVERDEPNERTAL